MKHNQNNQTLEDQVVEFLNEVGLVSTSFLLRKYKVNVDHAREILHFLVEAYENVKFSTPDQVYIEGREILAFQPRLQKKRVRFRPKKPSRWKDVSKPISYQTELCT